MDVTIGALKRAPFQHYKVQQKAAEVDQLTRNDGCENGSAAEAGAIPEHEAAASQLRAAVNRRTKIIEVWGPENLRKLQHYLGDTRCCQLYMLLK